MRHTISHGAGNQTLDFLLDEGEVVLAQPDSMVAMSTSIEISAGLGSQTRSRWLGGFRNMAAGESLFSAIFRAKRSESFLSLAPRLPGDILHLAVDSQHQYYLTQGSYLASSSEVKIDFQYAGMRGMLAKKGIFLMKSTGSGDLFCASFGAIVRRDLGQEEKFVVDNRFVIAYSDSVSFQLVKASKDVVGSYFSGGGLVNRYTGPGTIYYQTRGKPGNSWFGRMFDIAT